MIPALLDASLRALLIAALVGLALKVWRVRSGALRHAAWTAVVAAMLALPVLPGWVPTIEVPFSSSTLTPRLGAVPAKPAAFEPTTSATTVASSAATAPMPRSTSRSIPMPDQDQQSWSWALLAVGLWLSVAVVLLARVAIAWRLAYRLADDARAIDPSHATSIGPDIFESPRVAAPVTVGVWRPRIVLPLDWIEWPTSTLHAALVHERAHITRRDPLVSVVAELNLCVFWFHPLAWWLRRQLSKTAEQACDDRTLRFVCEPTAYAQVLVEMAGAVQRRGARVNWASLSIGDPSGLEQRLDRVLRGDGLREPSAWVRAAIAATCIIAVGLGVACREQSPELRPDPDTAAQLLGNAAGNRRSADTAALTLEGATGLEEKLAANPDDLDAMETLVYFYRFRAQKLMGWDAMLHKRRALQLQLIEHHPESDLASFPDILQQYDPVGYAQARVLWMAHANRPDATSTVLGNAAAFFTPSEKPVAEQLLLRASAIDPGGPTPTVVNGLVHQKWVMRLGTLYAQAIIGANDNTLGNVVKAVSLEAAHGPFASAVKAKLELSRDAGLLTAAGQFLIQNSRSISDQPNNEAATLGRAYLQRAAAIDPADGYTQRLLLREQAWDRGEQRRRALPGPVEALDDAKIAALSERERFMYLPELAELAYSSAENVEHSASATFTVLMSRAEKWANESVSLAEKFRDDPDYGTAIYKGHVILGTIALRNGDRKGAVAEMRLASTAPPSPTLEAGQTLGHYRLTNYLLKAGERESVAQFFEKVAAILPGQRAQLLKDAQSIRNGIMPMSYQYAFARPS